MFFTLAAVPMLLSCAVASPLSISARQTQFQITAFADGNCASGIYYTWPIDASLVDQQQCETFNNGDGMGSVRVDNVPAGISLNIQFGTAASCPLSNYASTYYGGAVATTAIEGECHSGPNQALFYSLGTKVQPMVN